MARAHLTERLAETEEAMTALSCRTDDACALLNPGARRYEPLKRPSDSEISTLALLRQLRGVESERSFVRECERFSSHPFPGVVGYSPPSFHRRARKLRRFFEPPRRAAPGELAGDPETLIADSTLPPVLHPGQVGQSASGFEGAAWTRWGSLCVCGVKPRLICSTNRVPPSCELTPANTADVLPTEELLAVADLDESGVVRRLLGDLACKSDALGRRLTEQDIPLAAEGASRRPAVRQQVEVCFARLKRVFGLGETLAATLVGLAIRIAAKVTAHTCGLYVNRVLGRPQGRIKELRA